MRFHVMAAAGAVCALVSASAAPATMFNNAPVAVNDSATSQCESIKLIGVLGNDYDPDGDPLTLVSAETNDLGSYAVVSGNAIEFSATYSGIQTIYYTIEDSHGAQAFGTVTVNVSFRPACEA
jgi:hypothetical protein